MTTCLRDMVSAGSLKECELQRSSMQSGDGRSVVGKSRVCRADCVLWLRSALPGTVTRSKARDAPFRISRQMRPSLSVHIRGVSANSPDPSNKRQRTDIRVVDLGQEANLRRAHGVFFWQEQLQPKHSIYNIPEQILGSEVRTQANVGVGIGWR